VAARPGLRPLAGFTLAAAAAVLAPSPGAAQLLRPTLEAGPYAGGFFTSDLELQDLRDAPLYGARGALRLPAGLAVEAQLGWAPLESSVFDLADGEREFDVSVFLWEAGLAWTFGLPGPLDPFVGVSAGTARFDPELTLEGGGELGGESALIASAGLGARLALGGLTLRADLREHLIFEALEETRDALGLDGGDTLTALEGSLGLAFRLF
jgi:hypothetical protein